MMEQNDVQKWDARYKETGFAFGSEPNHFFKEWLLQYPPSTLLLPAEGEGRNAVFAAQQGWKVTAFDLSIEGKEKAMALANEKGVSFEYVVDDCENISMGHRIFDAIAFIYAHFHADKKSAYHTKLNQYLNIGGIVILEAFSKDHLSYRSANPEVGGPTDINALYSEEEIKDYFRDFDIIYLKTEIVTLSEGKYHNGMGNVVRFVGRKLR